MPVSSTDDLNLEDLFAESPDDSPLVQARKAAMRPTRNTKPPPPLPDNVIYNLRAKYPTSPDTTIQRRNKADIISRPVDTAYGTYDADFPGWNAMSTDQKIQAKRKAQSDIENHFASQKQKPTRSAPELVTSKEATPDKSDLEVGYDLANEASKVYAHHFGLSALDYAVKQATGFDAAQSIRAGASKVHGLEDSLTGGLTKPIDEHSNGFFWDLLDPAKWVSGLVHIASGTVGAVADVIDPNAGLIEKGGGQRYSLCMQSTWGAESPLSL